MSKKLKDKIRESEDMKVEIVDIPEWDCKVEVREFSGIQRARLLNIIGEKKDEDRTEALFHELFICCMYDPEDGQPLFQKEDIPWLFKKNSKAIERLVGPAIRLNGLFQDSVKEEAKN